MAGARATGRVFSIAPGSPFLKTFVRRFLDGDIVPGFPGAADPLALSGAVIFVPTGRAAQELTREFVAASPRGIALLPAIIPLGRIELLERDASADFDSPGRGDDTAREISDFERQLKLAMLVRAWAATLPRAIVSEDGGGPEPQLIGASFSAAWSLAGELASLIDEFAIESISWDALDDLTPGEFDQYWSVTHRFLQIAGEQWPKFLEENGQVERVARQARLVENEIGRLAALGSEHPVLVVGSTGANATTARLLAAISKLPHGAIVLPGIDWDLDARAWAMLTRVTEADAEPAATHPQTAMARLLRAMGIDRADVTELGDGGSRAAARNHLLSEALRPAETTDNWHVLRESGALAGLSRGLDDVVMAVVADEREEALCIALKLRECVDQGRRAALVTPDRDIARRVQGQLRRWGLDIADSAGESLGRTKPGGLARLVLAAAGSEADNVDIVALLTHPLAGFGFEPETFNRVARLADLAVFRRGGQAFGDVDQTIASARVASEQRGAHPNARALCEADWQALRRLLLSLGGALAPLRAGEPFRQIAGWARAHKQALDACDETAQSSQTNGWDELNESLAELTAFGDSGEAIGFAEYAGLFDRVISGVAVRGSGGDPRAQILGLLEARLLRFDTIVLAGLDEGIWPPKSHSHAFLNRSMRAKLGMSPPERRIGQTAHDLTQAMGAGHVFMARALKRGGSPTVPSRFVQRIAALAGEDEWRACCERGAGIAGLARRLDARGRVRPAPPAPRPPLELRPLSLSVTRIETLRRDPYSIYAERILKLRPVDPLVFTLGAREYGTILHGVICDFSRVFHTPGAPGRTMDDLMALARRAFEPFLANPGFEEFSWPRLARVLTAYHQWETARAPGLKSVLLERSGALKIRLDDGAEFTLTAQADRIETNLDGSMAILDFKSGQLPTNAEIRAGFAPQLVLEARMLAEGAFGAGGTADIGAIYVKLGGPLDFALRNVGDKDNSLAELAARQFQGLRHLLNQLRDPRTAFVSRPYPQFLARFGDYDHLARVREWAAGADEGD